MNMHGKVFATFVRLGVTLFAGASIGLLAMSSAAASPIVQPTPVRCGASLDRAGAYVMVGSCVGQGITINADDVSLDLAGYTLNGDGTGDGIVVKGTQRTHVFGGDVFGYDRGIVLIGATGADVHQMKVGAGSTDIYVTGSAGCTITTNGLGQSFAGIVVAGFSSSCTLQNNSIDSAKLGIVLDDTKKNLVESNTVTGSTFGIVLDGGQVGTSGGVPFSNVLVDNVISQSVLSAIALFKGSEDNSVTDNTCTLSGTGILLDSGALGNTLSGNLVSMNRQGISVASGAVRNLIQHDKAVSNKQGDLIEANPVSGGACANTWLSDIYGTQIESGKCIPASL